MSSEYYSRSRRDHRDIPRSSGSQQRSESYHNRIGPHSSSSSRIPVDTYIPSREEDTRPWSASQSHADRGISTHHYTHHPSQQQPSYHQHYGHLPQDTMPSQWSPNSGPQERHNYAATMTTQNYNQHTSTTIQQISIQKRNLGLTRFRVERGLQNFDLFNQVGEGTYGKVFKGRDKLSGKTVALKKIYLKEGERGKNKDGYPLTMLREIDILKSLKHPNIIEFLAAASFLTPGEEVNLYMIFEYMDHDLCGLLQYPDLKWGPAEVKCLVRQLFSGLRYLHSKEIVHRDLKGANLLLDNNGVLKITDFGLARRIFVDRDCHIPVPDYDYTNRVVTLWYRSPELLLGSTRYGYEVDMWSAGCIMAEFFSRVAIFQARTEVEQLDSIFKICGTPTVDVWPNVINEPWYYLFQYEPSPRLLREAFHKYQLSPMALDLVDQLLALDPSKRPSAEKALNHAYFTTEYPPACDPSSIPPAEGDWHEFEQKMRKRGKTIPPEEAQLATNSAPPPVDPYGWQDYNGSGRDDYIHPPSQPYYPIYEATAWGPPPPIHAPPPGMQIGGYTQSMYGIPPPPGYSLPPGMPNAMMPVPGVSGQPLLTNPPAPYGGVPHPGSSFDTYMQQSSQQRDVLSRSQSIAATKADSLSRQSSIVDSEKFQKTSIHSSPPAPGPSQKSASRFDSNVRGRDKESSRYSKRRSLSPVMHSPDYDKDKRKSQVSRDPSRERYSNAGRSAKKDSSTSKRGRSRSRSPYQSKSKRSRYTDYESSRSRSRSYSRSRSRDRRSAKKDTSYTKGYEDRDRTRQSVSYVPRSRSRERRDPDVPLAIKVVSRAPISSAPTNMRKYLDLMHAKFYS